MESQREPRAVVSRSSRTGLVMLYGGIRLLEESGDSVFSTGLLYLATCPGASEVSVMPISPDSIL